MIALNLPTALTVSPRRAIETGGYIYLYAPGHPLCRGAHRRYVAEHRIVAYQRYGPGPLHCHWCNEPLLWSDRNTHVDHLDEIKTNNVAANLVIACMVCNIARSLHRMTATKREQSGNMLEFRGRRLHLNQWAQELGLVALTIRRRLLAGWTVERALTQPGRQKPTPAQLARRLAR